MKIEINDEFESVEEGVLLLEEITRKMREGFTSGYYPTWNVTK